MEELAVEELDIFSRMNQITVAPMFEVAEYEDTERGKAIAEHKEWLRTVRREQPSPKKQFKVGIYIRYFNQTRYENYIEYHVKQFTDTIALCPNWTLVGFYIDEGSVAPHMESAPEWSRLLQDCFDGKVDLIITQKISNVSRDPAEITFCSRILAAQTPPVGIYFISENIFTLASYYLYDLQDVGFFPTPDWKLLPDESEEADHD